MLQSLINKMERVAIASSPEERDAVYGFRYQIYVEELGRILGGADHERKIVCDEDDEASFSTHLYSGTVEEMSGTLRLRIWEPGRVPTYDFDMLSLGRFADIESMAIAELGRLMIRPTLRGKLVLPALARRSYELMCEAGVALAFCYCAPGLVKYYKRLGFRPYAGDIVRTVDGMHVPMVLVLSDERFLKRVGSPVANLTRRYFGKGKRAPFDLSRLAALLDTDAMPIELDAERVWGEVQSGFLTAEAGAPTFLDSLSDAAVKKLTARGLVVAMKQGTLITKEGYGEREMFILLEGLVEITHAERLVARLGPGDLFGEVAFFSESGKRSASVTALSDVRALVLRRRFIDELSKSDPAVACQVLMNLGRILSDRLVSATLAASTLPEPEGGSGLS